MSPYSRQQFKVDSFEQDLSMPLDIALIDSDISKFFQPKHACRQNQCPYTIFGPVYASCWIEAIDGTVLRGHVLALAPG